MEYVLAVIAKIIETGHPQWRLVYNANGTVDIWYFGEYVGRYDPGTTAG